MSAEFMFISFTIFLAGVIAVPLASRFGLGSVLGFLIAGIAIGPVLHWAGADVLALQHFTEFGVVMMLFVIGLEMKPKLHKFHRRSRKQHRQGTPREHMTSIPTFTYSSKKHRRPSLELRNKWTARYSRELLRILGILNRLSHFLQEINFKTRKGNLTG